MILAGARTIRSSDIELEFTRGPLREFTGSKVQCGGFGIICYCPFLIMNLTRLLCMNQQTGQDVGVKARKSTNVVQSCLFNEGMTTVDIFMGINYSTM